MKKTAIFFLTILISILVAAIYGAIHDQITYSIAPEYFTVFKFDQFGFMDWGFNNPRLTVALIGILATWWMGLLIGVFQALVGLTHKDYKQMFRYVMHSIFITLGVTALFGLIGFIAGKIDTTDYTTCCGQYIIKDGKSFMIVGSIHNYGYLGGEIGALVGITYQLIMRRKAKNIENI
ncbi:MAG: hypothetical protein PSV16_05580 [Flavobacterium sp.]|nr:hypothetical protein [Flavobacterium sp.]